MKAIRNYVFYTSSNDLQLGRTSPITNVFTIHTKPMRYVLLIVIYKIKKIFCTNQPLNAKEFHMEPVQILAL